MRKILAFLHKHLSLVMFASPLFVAAAFANKAPGLSWAIAAYGAVGFFGFHVFHQLNRETLDGWRSTLDAWTESDAKYEEIVSGWKSLAFDAPEAAKNKTHTLN